MKIFALYTLARLVLFLAVYGLLWLVFGRWVEWNSITALGTALIAMVISSAIALVSLRGLRDDLAIAVAARAARAKAAYEDRKRAEDDDLAS